MRGDKNLVAFHAERCELVDIEKAAVVDLVGSDAPKRQAVWLFVKNLMQQVKALRFTGFAIEIGNQRVDVLADNFVVARQRRQPSLDDFIFAQSLGDAPA